MAGGDGNGGSGRPDRWWRVATIAAGGAMAQTVLLWYWPRSLPTVLMGVGLATFAVVSWFNPAHFYRRIAISMVGLVGASGLIPGINAWLDIPMLGTVSLIIENQPWVPIAMLLVGAFFGVLDFRSRGHGGARATVRSGASDVRDHIPARGIQAGKAFPPGMPEREGGHYNSSFVRLSQETFERVVKNLLDQVEQKKVNNGEGKERAGS